MVEVNTDIYKNISQAPNMADQLGLIQKMQQLKIGQNQVKQSDIDMLRSRLSIMQGAIAPLLNHENPKMSDVYKAAADMASHPEAQRAGFTLPLIMTELQKAPRAPDGKALEGAPLKQWILSRFGQISNANEMLDRYYGAATPVDTGSGTAFVRNPTAGPLPPGVQRGLPPTTQEIPPGGGQPRFLGPPQGQMTPTPPQSNFPSWMQQQDARPPYAPAAPEPNARVSQGFQDAGAAPQLPTPTTAPGPQMQAPQPRSRQAQAQMPQQPPVQPQAQQKPDNTVYAGQPLGAEQSTNQYYNALADAGSYAPRMQAMDEARGLLAGLGPASTGPLTEKMRQAINLGVQLHIIPPDSQVGTQGQAYDMLAKQYARITAAMPGSGRSDAALQTAITGNPSLKLQKGSAEEILTGLQALSRLHQAGVMEATRIMQNPSLQDKNDPIKLNSEAGFAKWFAHFQGSQDWRAYAFDKLPNDKAKALIGKLRGDPKDPNSEIGRFFRSLDISRRLGDVTTNTQQQAPQPQMQQAPQPQ